MGILLCVLDGDGVLSVGGDADDICPVAVRFGMASFAYMWG